MLKAGRVILYITKQLTPRPAWGILSGGENMNEAYKLYNEFCDLDFWDYIDTFESDIIFVQTIINEYGPDEARQILKSYFN